ncbi:class II aldolase/adducin family protein [Klebsiella pneumoniae]|nr:class II aldolase/adducin family protein [Klebsiella pneumoniae]
MRVVLHLHPVYTTSLACLATPQILPIDQNTARYFNRVAVDTLYGGMADTAAEGARLAGLLADKRRLGAGDRPEHRRSVRRYLDPGARLSDPDHRLVNRPAAEGAVRRGGGKNRPGLGEDCRFLQAALCRDEAVDDRPRSLPGGLTPRLPGSARAIAGRRQQRHDDIAERRRNAVLTPATLHHAVTNIPLQRSAIEAIDQNRGA